MMKLTTKLSAFVFAVLMLGSITYAQSPREQLNQMAEQLQKTPSDHALREKIIKLAISIKPAPDIPEQAREPFVMGATVLKKASDPAGASKAVDLFTQAINVAPWFADAYYNRAIARETAGQFEAAIDDLKFYLEFKLTNAERREAQDKIYTLKAEAQLASTKKAEQDKIASADEAKRQAAQQLAEQARRFEGNWYRDVMTTRVSNNTSIRQAFSIVREQNGNWRLSGSMAGGGTRDARLEGTVFKFKDDADNGTIEYSGSVSTDGRRLRFALQVMPPTPAQMKMREQWGFGPNNRFGGDEWLKE